MLTTDRIGEGAPGAPMFFNPGTLNSWRELSIFGKTWRYRWEDHIVEIEGPDGRRHDTKSWTVLEVSEIEYREWERDPFDQPIVMAKDVDDYIREKIMRSVQARKAGAGIGKKCAA